MALNRTIAFEGQTIETSESGFLLDPLQWSEALALILAAQVKIELSEAHWEIVYFLRDYYFKYNHLPNARLFVKAVQKQFGEAKGNSRYLHGLFPGSAVKYACLIAGLSKPPGCI